MTTEDDLMDARFIYEGGRPLFLRDETFPGFCYSISIFEDVNSIAPPNSHSQGGRGRNSEAFFFLWFNLGIFATDTVSPIWGWNGKQGYLMETEV